MAFTYDYRPSPLVGTIGDLLIRGGDIRARAAEQIGQAQARAAEQRGEAYGTAISGIGRTVTALPLVLQEAQSRRTVDQMNQLKLSEAQKNIADQGRVDALLKGDQLPPGDTGPRQESFLTPEGLYDVPKLNQAFTSMGLGSKAPELVAGAERLNESIQKSQQTEQQHAYDHAIMMGDAADGVLTLQKQGVPIGQSIDLVSAPMLGTKRLTPQDVAQFKAQLAPLPPDQQIAALMQIRTQAERIAPTKIEKEGDIEHGRYGTVMSKGGEKPKNEAELAADAATLGTPKETPTAAASAKAMTLLKPAPNRTAEQDDQRYRDIQARLQQKEPVPIQDQAWAAAYEKQKTLGVDKSAAAATDRQTAAINAQVNTQKRGQDFQTLQTARNDIKAVDTAYSTAHTAAETLRDTVVSAQAGNKFAGSMQTLEGTMAALKAQGFSRLNTVELGVSKNAGTLWDNITGYLGKKIEGQPVPANIQKDMLEFADILDKAAFTKYSAAHEGVNKLYGTSIPRTYNAPVMPQDVGPQQHNPLTPGLQRLQQR